HFCCRRHVLRKCRNGWLPWVKADLFVQLRQRADESITFTDDRDQCALASVDNPRPQPDEIQIEAIQLVFGENNALDNATADGRDKLLSTAMIKQFEKTFPELLTAAGTEVQIIETDRI